MEGNTITISAEAYNQLNEKIDRLSEILEAQERRQSALVELKDDMTPVMNHAIKLIIDELSEVGMDFQLEDLLFLLKRILRNTKLMLRMMDQLEALSAIGDEIQLLGPQVMSSLVETLDEFERKGVFSLAKGSLHILEQIAGSIEEEKMVALGDKLGPISRKAVDALSEMDSDEGKAPSLFGLLRQMNDPEVRLILSRLLKTAKKLA